MKSTKRALILSALSLLMCVMMLMGTTYAWFTDSVTSGRNKIVAGNLDVVLYHTNSTTTDAKVGANTKLFTDVALWEPGAVAYETLTVKNEGTLALKYQMAVLFQNEVKGNDFGLSDVLKVGTLNGNVPADTERDSLVAMVTNWKDIASFVERGDLEADSATDPVTYVIYWEPSNGDNHYNMNVDDDQELSIDLGVNLVATQLTGEHDSFDDQYDKLADVLPAGVQKKDFIEKSCVALVGNTFYAKFEDALAAAGSAEGNTDIYVEPGATVPVTNTHAKLSGDFTVYGNGASFAANTEFDLGGVLENRTANIEFNNIGKVGIWGNVNKNAKINIAVKDCKNVHEVLVQQGNGATVNTTVSDCTFDGNNGAGMTGISQDCGGSITVTNTSFANMLCGVNVKNDYGVLDVSLKNCTFTDCGLKSHSENKDPNGNLGAAIRRGAKTGASGSIKVENCKIGYSENAEKVLGVDIVIGENRANKDGSGKISYEIKNTEAAVKVYTVHAAGAEKVEERSETASATASVSGDNGKVTTVEIAPGKTQEDKQEDINDALNSAEPGSTLNLVLPASETAYQLPALNVAKTLVISAPEGQAVKIDRSNIGGTGYSGSAITYRNLTLMGLTNVGSDDVEMGSIYVNEEHYENCTFYGMTKFYAPNTTFTNCKFIQEEYQYSFWVYGAGTHVFTDCVFECKGKAAKVFNQTQDAATVTNVTFNHCTFNAPEGNTNNEPAIAIATRGATFHVTCNGCTANHFNNTDSDMYAYYGGTLVGAEVIDPATDQGLITVVVNS